MRRSRREAPDIAYRGTPGDWRVYMDARFIGRIRGDGSALRAFDAQGRDLGAFGSRREAGWALAEIGRSRRARGWT